MEQYYRVDSTKIMHDAIDGEVVIVNLENGIYYNIEGIGAQLWQLITAGDSIQSALNQLQNRYAAIGPQVAVDGAAFLNQLEAERLIEPIETARNGSSITLPHIPYTTPALQKYTDMDQLLLLDPIHEVNEAGWPNTN